MITANISDILPLRRGHFIAVLRPYKKNESPDILLGEASAKQPFSATDTTVSMLVYKSVQSGQTCTHCTTIHIFSMQSVQPGQHSIVYPSLPKKNNFLSLI